MKDELAHIPTMFIEHTEVHIVDEKVSIIASIWIAFCLKDSVVIGKKSFLLRY